MNTTRLTNAPKTREQLIAEHADHYDYDALQTPAYNGDGHEHDWAPIKIKNVLTLSEELDIRPVNLRAQFEHAITDDNDDEWDNDDLLEFNNLYRTNLNQNELVILQDFAKDEHLLIIDAIDYIQDCHYCGTQLAIFGNTYCNKRCCELIEDYRYPCFRGDNCLICHGYPVAEVDTNYCFWGPDCDSCAAYTGTKEDQFCLFCVDCIKPMTDHEGYISNKELFCNLCILKQDISDEDGVILEEDSNAGQKVNDGWLNEETGVFHIGDWVNGLFIPYMDDVRNIAYFGLDEDDTVASLEDDTVASLEDEDEEQRSDSDDSHKRKRSLDEDDDEDDDVIISIDRDSEMHLKRLRRDDYMDISSNEYDYSESVVDDGSEIDSEEHEFVFPTHNDIIEQLQNENAELREALSNQSRIVFPDGYHIGFMMEDGVRYLQVFNGNPIVADNGPLTLADLDCEQSEQDSDMDI
jgi:hypothetical protein